MAMTSVHGATPIQTKYASVHFRSRLEARWAVFLDKMKYDWRYEPQSYNLPKGWTGRYGSVNYLPDFYLPELGLWVEVKGDWTTQGCWKFLECAASLVRAGADVLLLGWPSLNNDGRAKSPWRFSQFAGHLMATPWFEQKPAAGGRVILPGAVDDKAAGELLAGIETSAAGDQTKLALEAARSARFGWGGE